MRKRFFGSTFCAMLFALCFPPEAQQPAKIPRIGYVSVSGSPIIQGAWSRHFDKASETSVTMKGKTS